MSEVSQELMSFVKAKNEQTRAWLAEDPENRWAGFRPEDPEFYANQGIYTLEALQRQDLISYISDEHKTAYGFRPRGYDFNAMSMAELQTWADEISQAVEREAQRQADAEQEAVAEFEAQIQSNLAMGAADRDAAIRWILEADDSINPLWDDAGYACYTLGLPYNMEEVLRPALNNMRNDAVEAV